MNDSISKKRTRRNGELRTFWDGVASVFDLSGKPLISIPDLDSGFLQDYEALKGDWENIGLDLRHAMDIAGHEQ
jgi:hypothetical protein